jgi:hypothetical protein
MELRLLSVLPTLQVLPSVLMPLEPKLPGIRRRSMVRGKLPRVSLEDEDEDWGMTRVGYSALGGQRAASGRPVPFAPFSWNWLKKTNLKTAFRDL